MSRFDELVDRTGFASVKQEYTPDAVKKSGNISLWGAEFEFPTAPFVVDALVKWVKKGLYAYTVDDDSYHELIVNWMHMHRGWTIKKQWIVPVYGITSSLATAARVFTNPGDGIIAMVPGYHMYWEAVELSGRVKVPTKLIYSDRRYEIDWKDLEEKMSDPKNKMMVLCNPHNPLGRVWNKEELLKIADMAYKYNVIIFSDEIFAECLYDGVSMYTINQITDIPVKVLAATSIGKWLSFTGTNQANMIIPDDDLRMEFIKERDKEFYGSMNPMMLPAYYAAYTKQGERWIKEMMKYISDNYCFADNFFRKNLPQFHTIKPEGTYILWVDCRELNMEDGELQDFFINKAYFHVDHGNVYDGDQGFFRMNLSIPRKEIEKALLSLKKAVDNRFRTDTF